MIAPVCDRCGVDDHAAEARWCWYCGHPRPAPAKDYTDVLALVALFLGMLALWVR